MAAATAAAAVSGTGQAGRQVPTTEVVSRLKKDWPADMKAYDEGHEHMLMFADMLSDGIIKQNPKKMIMSEK